MKREAAENLDKHLVKKSCFSHKKPPFRTLNPTDFHFICSTLILNHITMGKCKLSPPNPLYF